MLCALYLNILESVLTDMSFLWESAVKISSKKGYVRLNT